MSAKLNLFTLCNLFINELCMNGAQSQHIRFHYSDLFVEMCC